MAAPEFIGQCDGINNVSRGVCKKLPVMKILVISAAYPPMHAGEATNTYHLCRQMAARDVEVHVLTSVGNVGTDDVKIQVHPLMQNWDWSELVSRAVFS